MKALKIAEVIRKDLDRLALEISAYPEEAQLWKVASGITNSGGNLALHIAGNLQHFIGTILGGTDYVRDRPAEFASREVPREHILMQIEKTKEVVLSTLGKVEQQLDDPYPQRVAFGPPDMTVLQSLVILASHLNYHLGQVNYHRRLLK